MIERITEFDERMQRYVDACSELGYKNNDSKIVMKFDWCVQTGGAWFASVDEDNEIFSISGIHPFKNGYRVLFRGSQLYPRQCGLNKYHMSSWCFYEQLPAQIKFAAGSPVYVTTNIDNDASGKMNKINTLFGYLERQGIVKHVSTEEVFYVMQNVWQLNVDRYYEVRK